MILSDILSKQKIDYSNPHEIILILFSMRDILQERYYNLVTPQKMITLQECFYCNN